MIQFSVILPNYNHAAFLKERIESVLNQTCQDFELIILDDCSTDNSKEIIESYRQHPKVSHIIYAEQNSGSPFGQWKKGMELAQYDWVWIAESDDIAMPRFLETAASQIAATENTGLYFCNSIVEITGQPNQTSSDICNALLQTTTWQHNYSIAGTDEINRALKYHSTIINASAAVFRKSLLKEKAAALSKFRYYGDWFAYLQILSASNIIYNHETFNRYRRTTASHSQLMTDKDKIQIKEECFRILYLLLQNPDITERKQLINWYVKKYAGFGFKTDGLKVIAKTAARYYSINFRLATRVIIKTLLLKLSSGGKS